MGYILRIDQIIHVEMVEVFSVHNTSGAQNIIAETKQNYKPENLK